MELDLEVCRVIAVRNGLPLQFVFKEFHLMHVLGRIAEFVADKPDSLIFKGGTALNKVYTKTTQRFSEDADFDLVIADADRKLLDYGKEIAKTMTDYKIDEFRKVGDTIQFYCRYETPLDGEDHVRVDIAPKRLVIAKPLENRSIDSEFTRSSITGIRTYSIEDLTARKMYALANRTEGKDVYDVSMALPMCNVNELKKAISCMLESEGVGNTEVGLFIKKMIKQLERSNATKQRNLTNPFIPLARRPKDWNELKGDLLLKLGKLVS